MQYAKFENGILRTLRLPLTLTADLTIDGVVHRAGSLFYTDNPAVLLGLGWKPLVYTPMPEQEGYYQTDDWQDGPESITQVWTAHEIPVDDTATEEDYLAALEELGVDVGGDGGVE